MTVEKVTKSGFKYSIDEDRLDDYELLEELCEIDKGHVEKIPDVIAAVLGSEQREALKDHVRCETGRVSAKKMIEEFMDIISGDNQGKNS